MEWDQGIKDGYFARKGATHRQGAGQLAQQLQLGRHGHAGLTTAAGGGSCDPTDVQLNWDAEGTRNAARCRLIAYAAALSALNCWRLVPFALTPS